MPRATPGPTGRLLRGVVHDFLKKDQPHFALLVALQASYVGSQSLGDELYQYITQHSSKKADRLVLLAELEYVVHNRFDARADVSVTGSRPDGCRRAIRGVAAGTALARQRGQSQRAVADLEKALDLEYQQMPELINLEAVRRDYRELLAQYLEVAKAAQTLGQDAPKDLAGRVIRATDRWRALDSEPRKCARPRRGFSNCSARPTWPGITARRRSR